MSFVHILNQRNDTYILKFREFSNERGRVEKRAQFLKERNERIFNEDFNGYLNWITEAGYSVICAQEVYY